MRTKPQQIHLCPQRLRSCFSHGIIPWDYPSLLAKSNSSPWGLTSLCPAGSRWDAPGGREWENKASQQSLMRMNRPHTFPVDTGIGWIHAPTHSQGSIGSIPELWGTSQRPFGWRISSFPLPLLSRYSKGVHPLGSLDFSLPRKQPNPGISWIPNPKSKDSASREPV